MRKCYVLTVNLNPPRQNPSVWFFQYFVIHCGGASAGQLCSCISPHVGQCSHHILEMNCGDNASLPFQDKSMFPLQTP